MGDICLNYADNDHADASHWSAAAITRNTFFKHKPDKGRQP